MAVETYSVEVAVELSKFIKQTNEAAQRLKQLSEVAVDVKTDIQKKVQDTTSAVAGLTQKTERLTTETHKLVDSQQKSASWFSKNKEILLGLGTVATALGIEIYTRLAGGTSRLAGVSKGLSLILTGLGTQMKLIGGFAEKVGTIFTRTGYVMSKVRAGVASVTAGFASMSASTVDAVRQTGRMTRSATAMYKSIVHAHHGVLSLTGKIGKYASGAFGAAAATRVLGAAMEKSSIQAVRFAGIGLEKVSLAITAVVAAMAGLMVKLGQVVEVMGVKLLRETLNQAKAFMDAEIATFRLTLAAKAAAETFGEAAMTTRDWNRFITEMAATTAFAEVEIRHAVGRVLELARNLGLSEKQVVTLIKATADLAAVNGVELYEALLAVTGAFMGNAMAAKRFGLDLTDAGVASMMFTGMTEAQFRALSRTEKAQARFNALIQQVEPFAGAATAQLSLYAGATKKLEAYSKAVNVEIGRGIATVYAPFVAVLSEISKALSETNRWILTVYGVLRVISGALLTAIGFTIKWVGAIVLVQTGLKVLSTILDFVNRRFGTYATVISGVTISTENLSRLFRRLSEVSLLGFIARLREGISVSEIFRSITVGVSSAVAAVSSAVLVLSKVVVSLVAKFAPWVAIATAAWYVLKGLWKGFSALYEAVFKGVGAFETLQKVGRRLLSYFDQWWEILEFGLKLIGKLVSFVGVELVQAFWLLVGMVGSLVAKLLQLLAIIPGLEQLSELARSFEETWERGRIAIAKAVDETLDFRDLVSDTRERMEDDLRAMREDVEALEKATSRTRKSFLRWSVELRAYIPAVEDTIETGEKLTKTLLEQVESLKKQVRESAESRTTLMGLTLEGWKNSRMWEGLTEQQHRLIEAYFRLDRQLRRQEGLRKQREALKRANEALREQIAEIESQILRLREGEAAFIRHNKQQILSGKGSRELKERLAALYETMATGAPKIQREIRMLEEEAKAAEESEFAFKLLQLRRKLGIALTEEQAKRILNLTNRIESYTTGIDKEIRSLKEELAAVKAGEEAEKRFAIAKQFGVAVSDQRVGAVLRLRQEIEKYRGGIERAIAEMEKELAAIRQGGDAWEAYRVRMRFAGEETDEQVKRFIKVRGELERARETAKVAGEDIPKTFGEGFRKAVTEVKTAGELMGRFGMDVARSISTAFTDIFFYTFKGQMEDAERAWTDFLDSLLRMAIATFIQMALMQLFPTPAPAGGGGGMIPIRTLQRGAVVRRPTLALIGEAGPEAVIPLEQIGRQVEFRPEISINIQAIDTRSGLQFLIDNRETIASMILDEFTRATALRTFVR